MDAEAYRDVILALECIAPLPEELQAKVAGLFEDASEFVRIDAGDVLFTEGAHSLEIGFILLSGEISVKKGSMAEFFLEAPQLVGEIQQFNPSDMRTATVIAQDDLEALRFDWGRLLDLQVERLTDDEAAQFRAALEDFAVMRFSE